MPKAFLRSILWQGMYSFYLFMYSKLSRHVFVTDGGRGQGENALFRSADVEPH